MTEKVAGFIFGCTDATEAECYSKSLFGITKEWRSIVSEITVGTPLFLFNYNSQSLFGLFHAASKGGENIDPDAWGGRFPAQVRFRKTSTYPSIRKEQLGFLKFEKGRPYPVLAKEQLARLTGLFEGKLPPQSPPAEQRYKTADGHWVRSRGEVIIDDCLFRHNIAHAYERSIVIVAAELLPDFYLPQSRVYVEYWGGKRPAISAPQARKDQGLRDCGRKARVPRGRRPHRHRPIISSQAESVRLHLRLDSKTYGPSEVGGVGPMGSTLPALRARTPIR